MAMAPATIMKMDKPRAKVTRSFRIMAEKIVLKKIEVSRRPATRATGACVMAQRVMP